MVWLFARSQLRSEPTPPLASTSEACDGNCRPALKLARLVFARRHREGHGDAAGHDDRHGDPEQHEDPHEQAMHATYFGAQVSV